MSTVLGYSQPGAEDLVGKEGGGGGGGRRSCSEGQWGFGAQCGKLHLCCPLPEAARGPLSQMLRAQSGLLAASEHFVTLSHLVPTPFYEVSVTKSPHREGRKRQETTGAWCLPLVMSQAGLHWPWGPKALVSSFHSCLQFSSEKNS